MKQEFCLKCIDLVVYDFDGVMTDNRVILSEDGKESVVVNRSDGLAVSIIKKLGLLQVIISTEQNPVVKMRAKKLDIPVINSVKNKKETLEEYCGKIGVSLERVAYIGNDINDLEAMLEVGYKVCPSDAEPEIIEIADIVLNRNGGNGAVRDFLRHLK